MKNINRLHRYSILLLAIFIFSCGEEESSVENLVEGTWNLKGMNYSGQTVIDQGTLIITRDFEGIGRNFEAANFTFNSDLTYSMEGDYVIDLTQTEDEETTTSELTISSSESGTYVIDNSVEPMTFSLFNDQGDASNGEITKLSESQLHFSLSTVVVQDITTITATINYTLEK